MWCADALEVSKFQFWRRNDPHGVKKIPVVCESNHVWLRALPEGLNPGATN